MSILKITGISFAVIGILVLIWGTILQPISLSSSDFMLFATGGLILLAAGLCMISTLPSIYRLAGIWLAALATMIYVYSLSDIYWIVKVIGFVPVLAVAVYLMSKFRK